jgi:hypothetical protein
MEYNKRPEHSKSQPERFLDDDEISELHESIKTCVSAIHELRDRFVALYLTEEELDEIKTANMLRENSDELMLSLSAETKDLLIKERRIRAPGLAFELLTRDDTDEDELYQLHLSVLAREYCSKHYANKKPEDLLKDQKALTKIGEHILESEELNARDKIAPYNETRYKYEKSLEDFYKLCTKLYSGFDNDKSIELLYIDDPYIDIGFSDKSDEGIIIHYREEDASTYIDGMRIKNHRQKEEAERYLIIISKIIDQLEQDLPLTD